MSLTLFAVIAYRTYAFSIVAGEWRPHPSKVNWNTDKNTKSHGLVPNYQGQSFIIFFFVYVCFWHHSRLNFGFVHDGANIYTSGEVSIKKLSFICTVPSNHIGTTVQVKLYDTADKGRVVQSRYMYVYILYIIQILKKH